MSGQRGPLPSKLHLCARVLRLNNLLLSHRGRNQWPAKPSNFKEGMQRWIEKMKELGMIVMKAQVSRQFLRLFKV